LIQFAKRLDHRSDNNIMYLLYIYNLFIYEYDYMYLLSGLWIRYYNMLKLEIEALLLVQIVYTG